MLGWAILVNLFVASVGSFRPSSDFIPCLLRAPRPRRSNRPQTTAHFRAQISRLSSFLSSTYAGDLHDDLFAGDQPVLETAGDINGVLCNLVTMVAKGRISSRRAAVISYALSLILRTVVVIDRKIANTPPQILWDAPRPNRSAGQTRCQRPDQWRDQRRGQRRGSLKGKLRCHRNVLALADLSRHSVTHVGSVGASPLHSDRARVSMLPRVARIVELCGISSPAQTRTPA